MERRRRGREALVRRAAGPPGGRRHRLRREYRTRDHAAELLATGAFDRVTTWTGHWSRELDWPTYERWLRSKSYVAALPDQPAFLAAERDSLARAFPHGRIVEPFVVRLFVAWV